MSFQDLQHFGDDRDDSPPFFQQIMRPRRQSLSFNDLSDLSLGDLSTFAQKWLVQRLRLKDANWDPSRDKGQAISMRYHQCCLASKTSSKRSRIQVKTLYQMKRSIFIILCQQSQSSFKTKPVQASLHIDKIQSLQDSTLSTQQRKRVVSAKPSL